MRLLAWLALAMLATACVGSGRAPSAQDLAASERTGGDGRGGDGRRGEAATIDGQQADLSRSDGLRGDVARGDRPAADRATADRTTVDLPRPPDLRPADRPPADVPVPRDGQGKAPPGGSCVDETDCALPGSVCFRARSGPEGFCTIACDHIDDCTSVAPEWDTRCFQDLCLFYCIRRSCPPDLECGGPGKSCVEKSG
jgi:hypothetical protein